MARNRRQRPKIQKVIRNVIRRMGVLIVILVTAAVGYIWMGIKCSSYGDEIHRLEIQNTEQDNEHVRESFKWNAMKSPEQLDAILLRHGLQMSYPNAGQIVRLPATIGTWAGSPALAAGARAAGGGRVAGGGRDRR